MPAQASEGQVAAARLWVVNCYIEACGIAPVEPRRPAGARAGLYESATVRVNATGVCGDDGQPQATAKATNIVPSGDRRKDRYSRGI